MRGDLESAQVRKRSLTIAGHRTSISLEDAFWEGLQSIADRSACSVAALVAEVDRGRGRANLSSAVRVFVLAKVKAEVDPLASGNRQALPASAADAPTIART